MNVLSCNLGAKFNAVQKFSLELHVFPAPSSPRNIILYLSSIFDPPKPIAAISLCRLSRYIWSKHVLLSGENYTLIVDQLYYCDS